MMPTDTEVEDISDIQGFVDIAFKYLGFGWDHPRVIRFLESVAERTGRPCPSRHHLSVKYYRMLAMRLAELIRENQEAMVGQLSVDGAIAVRMAAKWAEASVVGQPDLADVETSPQPGENFEKSVVGQLEGNYSEPLQREKTDVVGQDFVSRGNELPNNTGGSGWIEVRWVTRSGKKHGPYRYRCWRVGGKKRCEYLGKVNG
jgi:hypothetical protein